MLDALQRLIRCAAFYAGFTMLPAAAARNRASRRLIRLRAAITRRYGRCQVADIAFALCHVYMPCLPLAIAAAPRDYAYSTPQDMISPRHAFCVMLRLRDDVIMICQRIRYC